jgi:hypothetical protein
LSVKGSTMTVEPFTHLRPLTETMPTCITPTPFPVPWLQACRAGSRCRWAAAAAPSGAGRPGIPVLLPRGVGRAGVLARVLQVAGAAWFRCGMQVVVLPAVGPGAAQREVSAGVGF